MKDQIATLRSITDLLQESCGLDKGRQALFKRLRKELEKTNFKLNRSYRQRKSLTTFLARTSEDLEKSSEIIKKMFGRYLSNEVMNALLDDPATLDLGGERRRVTIMMTDLRGFTALSEQLSPEQVVAMLNSYFEVMVDVILEYKGTINEIIGDALLVIFGAPQEISEPVQSAVACAIEMQNAMEVVNKANREAGLPELEMGIGLNETEVVVGNIGSAKRSKYAVVGSGVNMTSRIESFSVGGQILISKSVYDEASDILRIDAQRDVFPKGAEKPLRIYEVGGIAGNFNLVLERHDASLVTLVRRIPVQYKILTGKSLEEKVTEGSIVRLSQNCAEIVMEKQLSPLTNLKMSLGNVDEKLATRHFYGKVVQDSEAKGVGQLVRFTSVPPELDAYFQAHIQHTML